VNAVVRRRRADAVKRARIAGIVVFLAVGATGATGWLLATRHRPAPPGDVREVIASYLTDAEAAREKYHDAPVTASGVVAGSARGDVMFTRAADHWSPQLDELSKQALVTIIVDDHHEVWANFGAENQREALALRKGERVTIKGRHTGYTTTGVVYDGKVILVLDGCEFVR
jgi:hypothetical protein